MKEFNLQINKAAKENIPGGVRKIYSPYWIKENLTYDELTRIREEAESNPSQNYNLKLQHAKAIYLRAKIDSKIKSRKDKTAAFKLEKGSTKLWKLTK